MDFEAEKRLLITLRRERERLYREARVIETRMGKPTLVSTTRRAEAKGISIAIKEISRQRRG